MTPFLAACARVVPVDLPPEGSLLNVLLDPLKEDRFGRVFVMRGGFEEPAGRPLFVLEPVRR